MEGSEIFNTSSDEEKRKGLHPSRRYYPEMREPRAAMKTLQNRRNHSFAKHRKRLKEGLAAIQHDRHDEVSEESSDEDAVSTQTTPLSSDPTTSLSRSLHMKPSNPPNIVASSAQSYSNKHAANKLAPSTDPTLSPPMSPICAKDPFDSDEASISLDDSTFWASHPLHLASVQLHFSSLHCTSLLLHCQTS